MERTKKATQSTQPHDGNSDISDEAEALEHKSRDQNTPTSQKGKFEETIKSGMNKVKESVNEFKTKMASSKKVQKVTRRFESLIQKRENPAFLVKLDEFSFALGIMIMFMTFALLFYPNSKVLAVWVTVINMFLLFLRWFDFKSKNWHYYYFDYCYYVNLATWAYLWLFPRSEEFFIVVFMNAMGPLLNYFIIFKPKLIYQSRDAITGFFMHFTPSLLFGILRYYNADTSSEFIMTATIDKHIESNGLAYQAKVFALGLLFYIGWILYYYLMVFHVRKRAIKARNIPTLYSYTVDEIKIFNNMILYFGERFAPYCYMALHLLQGVLGMILSLAFFNFKWICIVGLIVYLMIPIWNSSVYYFEYFSRDYHEKLHKRATDFKEKRLKKSASSEDVIPKRRSSDSELTQSSKGKAH